MTGEAARQSAPGSELPLQTLIRASHRLDELSTARVIGQAAEAVHKAQKGGQALGTLSPAAIVVRASGDVSLELPPAGVTGYAAPERLRGSPGDRRSDVFSLGVLLWEALAHERLFDGASDDAVKAAVMSAEFRPPSACNANVPAELDAICKKALARDPADRYQSAKVMAAEISAVLDDAGYPDSNEALARYVGEVQAQAASAPAAPAPPAPEPAKISTVSQEWTAIGRTTSLGVAPVRAEEPVLLDKQIEPAPVMLEKKKEAPAEAGKPAPLPGLPPKAVKVPDVRPRTPTPGPAAPGARAKSPTPGPAAPAVRAKSPTPAPADRPRTPTPPPPSSLPAWALARAAQGEPAVPPTTTLLGSPSSEASAPAPPSASTEASPPPAAAPAAASDAPVPLVLGPIPGGTVEPSSPSRLGVLPPGSQTAILGSIGAAAEPAPAPAPAPAAEPAPVPLGPSSDDDAARLASVKWHDTPAVPFAKPSISEAPTVQTPSLTADAPAPAGRPATPVEHTASQAGSIPAAGSLPPSEDDFVEPKGTPHPASVVALRARSRSDQSGTDMLGGWGWGTDAHSALDDDVYEETGRSRKRLMIAIGGGAAAILLVTIIALAAGGSKDEGEPPAPATQAAKAWDDKPAPAPAPPAPAEPAPAPPAPGAPSEPATPEPARPEPTAPEAAAAEPAKPEPAKPEPAKPEPAKPEPAKPEPPKPEPPKVAAKPEPPKVAAKPEPPKAAPKPAPKPAPKVAARPDAKWEPKKPAAATARKPDKQPIDPYATDTRKVDPNAAYRTGLQQFARGDSNGALATFKASLAANPGYAPTWRGIGLVYEKIGRTAQARTAFQKYLELAPSAGDAGQIRERMGRLR